MRAWLLLLAVLATFQPIVQVASTEDITSSFIQAISPTIIEEEQQQHHQQQLQQDLFELAKQRDTRTINNNNNKNNNNNNNKNNNNSAQQLVAASRQLTAISPVIDITALSVTKRTQSATTTKAKTAIATIFSYNRRSDSDNYTNNGNHLNQFSAKDIKANGSGATNSDATTAIVVAVQEKQKQKINKQITKTNQKHNEVNDKHNNLIEITRNKNNNNNNAVQVQQLANTSDKTKSAQATTTAKSTKTLKATTSAVLSEQVEAEVEEEAEKSEMAIQEHTLATAQEHSKRHRNHKKQQQQHRQQQKQQHMHQQQQHKQQQQHLMQQQHSATQHTATGARTHLATAERLAASEATTTTHLEAAEKLAQDASLVANTPAARTSAASDASTASVSEDDEGDSESDVTEPATYSNKEIIGDKLKPDPSTLVQIENSLLSLFNMKRPPKIDRSKIIIPEAMKQLYAQIMGHELDMETIRRPSMLSRSANTVRSFTHIESKIDDRFPHHHRFRLYFNVKSIPTEEKLRAADLQLSREAISDAVLSERLANRTSYQVLVYDITRVGVRGKREPSYKLLDNKLVHLNSTDTVSLDVQRAVDRWLATPKKNYGLLIEVRTLRTLKPAPHHHVRLRRSVDEPHDSWQHKQPVLYAYTDDGKHRMRAARDATTSSSRSKRAGHHRRAHRRKNSDEICRRHSLYVDFADVGWSDWIVAPPGYDAFYCQGKCPFPLAEHLNSTNHAVVQTLVNNLNPGKVPKACCVPTQLEGISMLYLNDQNTVVLKNYQDMTVVGCGCR